MLKNNSTVSTPVNQNVQNVSNGVETPEFVFVDNPFEKHFNIKTITKRMSRLINTGNYQNTTIETQVEAEVSQEHLKEATEYLEKYINEDLDRQEKEIRDKLAAVEEAKEQEKIKQSEAMAAKMKQINLHKWKITNLKGEEVVVSNDLHYQMVCPICGGKLEKKKGKFGEFWGCENYATTKCGFGINTSVVTKFLNDAVQFIETKNPPHPEKIYGYQTGRDTVMIDTEHAFEQEQQVQQVQKQMVQQPIQQPIQQQYADEELPF